MARGTDARAEALELAAAEKNQARLLDAVSSIGDEISAHRQGIAQGLEQNLAKLSEIADKEHPAIDLTPMVEEIKAGLAEMAVLLAKRPTEFLVERNSERDIVKIVPVYN